MFSMYALSVGHTILTVLTVAMATIGEIAGLSQQEERQTERADHKQQYTLHYKNAHTHIHTFTKYYVSALLATAVHICFRKV